VPIPSYLIEKFAGKQWTEYKVRESIAGVQEMVESGKDLGLNASNLILALQGKVYEDWACTDVSADILLVAMGVIAAEPACRTWCVSSRSWPMPCSLL
jgi:hypothetical protein